MSNTMPHRSTSRKKRGGGVVGYVVLALIAIVVVRAGGPLPLAREVTQLALDLAEIAGCLAGTIAAAVAAALAIRFALIRWRARGVHVITDAAWPRTAWTTSGGRSWR
jgi:hypothetical protein